MFGEYSLLQIVFTENINFAINDIIIEINKIAISQLQTEEAINLIKASTTRNILVLRRTLECPVFCDNIWEKLLHRYSKVCSHHHLGITKANSIQLPHLLDRDFRKEFRMIIESNKIGGNVVGNFRIRHANRQIDVDAELTIGKTK